VAAPTIAPGRLNHDIGDEAMNTTLTLSTLNTITLVNSSGLDPSKYTVWVAGFIQDASTSGSFYILQSDGSFSATSNATVASFVNANKGLTIAVPDVTNAGNNRLIVTITEVDTTPPDYPITGYTAYPFPGVPGVCPPGPYDIFEFGPNAQYDVSAVDSFGINLSFTVSGDSLTYGVVTSVTRKQVGTAFQTFTSNDPLGAAFSQLLYTSPTGSGYPEQIAGQFSAIVSPKEWLAINPTATGLTGYWDTTVDAFFTAGNMISLYLNGATIGTYEGRCDGNQYTLSGPANLQITIPKSDFSGNQGFIQAVRPINRGEPAAEYAAFGQIEAALFEAFSRGVALDGVFAANPSSGVGPVLPKNFSSDAWTDTANWYTAHKNAYNNQPSVYDVYAKFFHLSTPSGTVFDGSSGTSTIFGMNSGQAYGMAYGFSLDENPNVGSSSQGIPPGSWPASLNTPAKTLDNIGAEDVTLTIGPWQ
jgi:Beta-1,3-glucanase